MPRSDIGPAGKEKIVVLRRSKIARKGLIEVMVSIDETGEDDLPSKIDHRVGRSGKVPVWAHVLMNPFSA